MFFIESLKIAAFVFVYVCILIEPTKILGKWWGWLWIVFKTDKRNEAGKDFHWLHKILGACSACCTGQIALWYWLIVSWKAYSSAFADLYAFGIFMCIVQHLLFITWSIFLIYVFQKLHELIIKHLNT